MFFGRRGPMLYARIALLAVFLLAVFVFHAHGTTLHVLQVLRFAVLIAIVASALVIRRRNR
jgi:hypothetical protein